MVSVSLLTARQETFLARGEASRLKGASRRLRRGKEKQREKNTTLVGQLAGAASFKHVSSFPEAGIRGRGPQCTLVRSLYSVGVARGTLWAWPSVYAKQWAVVSGRGLGVC